MEIVEQELDLLILDQDRRRCGKTGTDILAQRSQASAQYSGPDLGIGRPAIMSPSLTSPKSMFPPICELKAFETA